MARSEGAFLTPQTDTRWYGDEQINYLLQYFFEQNRNVRIFDAINAYQNYGGTLVSNLDERKLQEVLQEDPRDISILPINLGDQYWAALFLHFSSSGDRSELDVWYFDPYGDRKIPGEVYNAVGLIYPHAKTVPCPIQLQRDNYNCGPWIIAIFQNIIERGGLPPEDFNIDQARAVYNEMSVHISVDRQSACSIPTQQGRSSGSSSSYIPILSQLRYNAPPFDARTQGRNPMQGLEEETREKEDENKELKAAIKLSLEKLEEVSQERETSVQTDTDRQQTQNDKDQEPNSALDRSNSRSE